MLVVLAGLLTAGCLGDGEPEEVVVAVTQEAPANAAGSTPTWQQWLGEQVSKGKCGDQNNILMYQNVRKEPPYSADFFCRAQTPIPNVVATQVAATVAAIPTTTKRPAATPWPTPTPPRPTLAPVSTPTATWQQTATPIPQPPPEYLLTELNSIMAADTAVCESSGGTNRVEKLRTEPGESYPAGNWGEYDGTTWYWEHHCDIHRSATVRGEIIPGSRMPGYLEVSGFSNNWESYKQATFALYWNEDGTWEDYMNCVYDGGIFVVEDVHHTPETEGGWTIEWYCRTPAGPTQVPEPTVTPRPLPTRGPEATAPQPPTAAQARESDLETARYAESCETRGGRFFITDEVHYGGRQWNWKNNCSEPTKTWEEPLSQYSGVEKAVAALTLYIKTNDGTGSGFFYSRVLLDPSRKHEVANYIVTNLHVTQDHQQVKVCWAVVQTCVNGRVIAKGNERFDVAVIEHEGFHVDGQMSAWLAQTLGYMSGWGGTWDKGNVVHASGYPGGNLAGYGQVVSDPVVTDGIVVAEELQMWDQPFIEHGADVEPGSSGGPLMNTDGYIVGMNTAGSREHERLELAVPVDSIIRWAESWNRYSGSRPTARLQPTGGTASWTVAYVTGTVKAGNYQIFDLSEAHQNGYRRCYYEVQAARLDIEVRGQKARYHAGWINTAWAYGDQIRVSNEYSIFEDKEVHVSINCYE